MKAIYGDRLPSGRDLEIKEIVLSREGPRIAVTCNLPEWPEVLPGEWVKSGFNQVHAKFLAASVHQLSIDGISTNPVASMILSEEEGRLRMSIVGQEMKVEALVDAVFLSKTGAYRRSS